MDTHEEFSNTLVIPRITNKKWELKAETFDFNVNVKNNHICSVHNTVRYKPWTANHTNVSYKIKHA